MTDVLMLVVLAVTVTLLRLLLAACDRIVGPDPVVHADEADEPRAEEVAA